MVNARFGLARELLLSTDQSIGLVARNCGPGSAISLRLHFRRALNTTPSVYRRAFTRQTPDSST